MSKITQYILAIVLAAMGIVLISNIALFFYRPSERRNLSYTHIQGMAIKHKEKEYTLNFDQQNTLTGYFNKAIPIPKQNFGSDAKPVDFSEIIIYRFNQPSLHIVPIGFVDGLFVFKSSEWNPTGYFQESGTGDLADLFPTMYDH